MRVIYETIANTNFPQDQFLFVHTRNEVQSCFLKSDRISELSSEQRFSSDKTVCAKAITITVGITYIIQYLHCVCSRFNVPDESDTPRKRIKIVKRRVARFHEANGKRLVRTVYTRVCKGVLYYIMTCICVPPRSTRNNVCV